MPSVPRRLGEALAHPIAAPLVVGGGALVLGSLALLLLTFWLLVAFVWFVPMALGVRQILFGIRVAEANEDAESIASTVRVGLIAAVATLNPVAFGATWLASRAS